MSGLSAQPNTGCPITANAAFCHCDELSGVKPQSPLFWDQRCAKRHEALAKHPQGAWQ